MITRRHLLQSTAFLGVSRFLPAQPLLTPHQNGYGVYLAANETTVNSGKEVNLQTQTQYIQMHMIPAKGWAFYDQIILPLEAVGQRFVFMFYGMPGQVAPLSDRNLLDENGNIRQGELDWFEQYARACFERYKGPHIWMWEEEADSWWDRRDSRGRLDGGWGGKAPEFVEVLRAMCRALEAARASVGCQGRICLPSLAFENWAPAEQRPTFDMDWITNVANAGGMDLVDLWGCNYYAPGFYVFHGNGPFSIINKLKKAQAKLPPQYRFKPLFVNTGQPASEPGQEVYMSQAAAHLWAAPFLHSIPVEVHTVFCWQYWQGWGLHNQDGTPNAAHYQFRMTNELIKKKPVLVTGSLERGYTFMLDDNFERRLVWNCTNANDIQAVANWWRRGTTIMDIMSAGRGFGLCK